MFFFKDFIIFRTLAFLSVLPLYQCVYTHQAGRTPALQQNSQSSEKSQHFKEKTQYLMNTLYNNSVFGKKKLNIFGATCRKLILNSLLNSPLIIQHHSAKLMDTLIFIQYTQLPCTSLFYMVFIFSHMHTSTFRFGFMFSFLR